MCMCACVLCVCLHVHTGIVKACRETGGSKLGEALNFEKFQKTVPPKKKKITTVHGDSRTVANFKDIYSVPFGKL